MRLLPVTTYGEDSMIEDHQDLITGYFKQWQQDIERAESLITSDQFFLEGLLVLCCYVGALGRLRYPKETRDLKSYKTIVWEYSSQKDVYENIDMLFFYQWPRSILADKNVYQKLRNYSELVNVFNREFGDEAVITNQQRYQKREELARLAKRDGAAWFDESNFKEHIELFSNNQILYEFVRCEAVHNVSFPLLDRVLEQGKSTYRDNHQITRNVILTTVKNIIARLEKECIERIRWPWELYKLGDVVEN
ncbi:MAG: hypothetical protein V2A69_06420 [Pseudomonadota bacterium]